MTQRLDAAVAARGLARSRTHAAQLITAGLVSVDGHPVVKASVKVGDDQQIVVAASDHYVSRAAHKLLAALDGFGVDVTGRQCLDLGASTGGFTQVLAPLAEAWGVHAYCANELEVRDGHLTGKVLGDVVDRAAKAAMLRAWAEDAGLTPEQAVGVGDGANDIDLLEAAGCGVALCAKPILREHADVVVDVPSFTPLRWLLGL